MRDSDVRVRRVQVSFRDVRLTGTLTLSTRAVAGFTLATAHATVVNRRGALAVGKGASVFSIPWAWPDSATSIADDRDHALRRLAVFLGDAVVDTPAGDPVQIWQHLDDVVTRRAWPADLNAAGEEIPRLAALLALGAVDNAIHDAWSRAARKPAYAMYNRAHLNDDLRPLLGADFAGRYAGDYLATTPRTHVPVQHVVGASDLLQAADARAAERSLADWLRSEQTRHVKLKLAGRDPDMDAQHVCRVYEIAERCVIARYGKPELSLDPNEGYASPIAVLDLLAAVHERNPAAAEAIRYVEQPVSRDEPADAAQLSAVAERIPVVMDEGFTDLQALKQMPGSGWSGIVIKAVKGQTLALLAHSYARARGLFLSMQDLTAVDLALRHSARLASVFVTSVPQFEYNSRQYVPHANQGIKLAHPQLVTVNDGHIVVDPPDEPGLY